MQSAVEEAEELEPEPKERIMTVLRLTEGVVGGHWLERAASSNNCKR